MAAAGSHPTPIRHSRAREAREHARKSAAEHPQQASAEIDKTCQETTAGVRRGPDTALERMRDVGGELRRRAEHQTAERQDAREQTSDKAGARCRRPGIRAQRTHNALEDSRTNPQADDPSRAAGAEGDGANPNRRSSAGGPVALLPESVRRIGRVEARSPRSTSWS